VVNNIILLPQCVGLLQTFSKYIT